MGIAYGAVGPAVIVKFGETLDPETGDAVGPEVIEELALIVGVRETPVLSGPTVDDGASLVAGALTVSTVPLQVVTKVV